MEYILSLIQAVTDNLPNIITVAAGSIVVWLGRSYIISHAFDWLLKLLTLLVVDSIFRLFNALFLDNLRIYILYIFNNGPYKFLPYSGVQFIHFLFVLAVSWQLFLWVRGHHVNHEAHGSTSHGKKN